MRETWIEHNLRKAGERIGPMHGPRPSFVYLGQFTHPSRAKIGRSMDPHKRRAEIRHTYGDPRFEMVWQAIGGAEMEQALHGYFHLERVDPLHEFFDFIGRDAVAEIQAAYDQLRSQM